jgi:hypothetical protein
MAEKDIVGCTIPVMTKPRITVPGSLEFTKKIVLLSVMAASDPDDGADTLPVTIVVSSPHAGTSVKQIARRRNRGSTWPIASSKSFDKTYPDPSTQSIESMRLQKNALRISSFAPPVNQKRRKGGLSKLLDKMEHQSGKGEEDSSHFFVISRDGFIFSTTCLRGLHLTIHNRGKLRIRLE